MSPEAAAAALPRQVRIQYQEIQRKSRQACTEGAKELRNSALQVLANPSPSPPGSPPGVRSGNLRRNWTMESSDTLMSIKSGMDYAGYLEDGTRKMAARPFVDKIIETAEPKILEIFSRLGE